MTEHSTTVEVKEGPRTPRGPPPTSSRRGVLPDSPPPDTRFVIDKTAEIVARHGPDIEDRILREQSHETFAFLLPNGAYRACYQAKLRECQLRYYGENASAGAATNVKEFIEETLRVTSDEPRPSHAAAPVVPATSDEVVSKALSQMLRYRTDLIRKKDGFAELGEVALALGRRHRSETIVGTILASAGHRSGQPRFELAKDVDGSGSGVFVRALRKQWPPVDSLAPVPTSMQVSGDEALAYLLQLEEDGKLVHKWGGPKRSKGDGNA